MSQLIFKFPFKAEYFKHDFYVSSNNFPAYKLIESWPRWPGKWLNIYGDSGSGKTHLSKILEKKIGKVKIINSPNINKETKNPTQIDETDLEQILETLNLNFQKNKNWSKEIKAIFEHNNVSFINHFSRELDVLKKYAYLPPPTIDELKFSFNELLPSILQNLPSQNKSFLNDKINWIISSIKLRKSEMSDGNEPYDFLFNVEYYLDKENLDKVLDNFENLPATMKKPALDWFENLNSRISVNNSINAITNNYRNFIK